MGGVLALYENCIALASQPKQPSSQVGQLGPDSPHMELVTCCAFRVRDLMLPSLHFLVNCVHVTVTLLELTLVVPLLVLLI